MPKVTTRSKAKQSTSSCKNNKRASSSGKGGENAELGLLREKNRQLKEALDAVTEKSNQMASYYFWLVWLARDAKRVPNDRMKSELGDEKYEDLLKDFAALKTKNGDFYHGFNSGCLAMSRLMMGLAFAEDEKVYFGDDDPLVFSAADQRQFAKDQFPSLDI